MWAEGRQHSLIPDDLAALDEKHVHRVFGVELVDLQAIGLSQIVPAHFLDKNLVSKTISLRQQVQVLLCGIIANEFHGRFLAAVHGQESALIKESSGTDART